MQKVQKEKLEKQAAEALRERDAKIQAKKNKKEEKKLLQTQLKEIKQLNNTGSITLISQLQDYRADLASSNQKLTNFCSDKKASLDNNRTRSRKIWEWFRSLFWVKSRREKTHSILDHNIAFFKPL